MSIFLDRPIKNVPHDFASGTDVATASRRRTDVLYYTTSIKWSSTVTNRLMFEAAWGAMANGINFIYQPGIQKERGTAEWYATASRQDIVLNTRTVAAQPEQHDYPYIYMAQSSATYVTGSHSLKTGFQWRYGPYWRDYSANADLVQRYSSGVPDSVTVYNTPTHPRYRLNADVGVYVQDSWKIQAADVNPGIRFEYFNSQIDARSIEPGRFIGLRQFPEVADLPNWFNVAPRFAAVYDLTGDVKTALKFSLNKYNLNDTTDFAARYDAASLQSDTRNWRDCDYLPGTSTCSGRVLADQRRQHRPGQRDRSEQQRTLRRRAGAARGSGHSSASTTSNTASASITRCCRCWRSARRGIDAPGTTWSGRTTCSWRRPSTRRSTSPSPLNGEIITVYNLDRSKQGLVDALDTNGVDRSKTRRTYDGLEVNFSARLPKGGSVFGGWSADKNVSVACELDNPNFASDPSTATPWSYRYCDQSAQSMPFRNDFKVTGAYPLPLDMQVGATWASYAGDQLRVNWSVPANLFPGGRTQSVTIDLIPPGSKFLERWNQVDLSLRKLFNMQRTQLNISLDMFNVLNSNVVLSETQAYGPALGNPTSILQPRLLRISGSVKF